MVIYSLAITAVAAFFTGFAVGYFFFPKYPGSGKKAVCTHGLAERSLSADWAALLAYDGLQKPSSNN